MNEWDKNGVDNDDEQLSLMIHVRKQYYKGGTAINNDRNASTTHTTITNIEQCAPTNVDEKPSLKVEYHLLQIQYQQLLLFQCSV